MREEVKAYFSKGIPIKPLGRSKVLDVEFLISKEDIEIGLADLPSYMSKWDVEAKRSYIYSALVESVSEYVGSKTVKREKKSLSSPFPDDYPVFTIMGNKMFANRFGQAKDDYEIVVEYGTYDFIETLDLKKILKHLKEDYPD